MSRAARVIPAVLFLAAFAIYMLTGRVSDYGDNLANRYLPLTIVRHLSFDLAGIPSLYDGKVFFSLRPSNGYLVSTYPVGTAVAAAPLYVVPALLGLTAESAWLPMLEKVAAAAMAALSVIVLYLALARLTDRGIALLIGLVYGLGTTTFSISSQGLFQHTGSQLFLCVTLYLLVRAREGGAYAAWAGLPLAAAAICRPADLVMAAPLAAYVLRRHRASVPGFLALALSAAVLQAAYGYVYFDSWLVTGYGAAVFNPWSTSWSSPFLDGFLGLTVSPRVGLFVYSPIFLFSCVGMVMSWRRGADPLLRYVAVCPVLMLLVCSRWAMWWGAWNYGPRLLADASPFLAVLLLPVFEGARRVAAVKVALFGSALLSIAVHALGAFFNDGSWNVQIAGGDPSWSWRASPIAHYSKRALASLSAKDPSPTLAVPRLPDSHVAPLRVAATHEAALPPTRVVSAEPIRLSVRAELGVGVERRGVETGAGVWLQPTADPRGAPRSGMPTKGCDLADVTAEATNPERGPFEVAFSTDKARYRPGELLNARLTFRNSGAARLVRIHVLREAPGGDFAFLDTGRFRPYRSCDPWTTAGIVDFVPAGFSAPEPLPSSAFGWSLRDVPPGDYRLHVVVIEGSGSAPALVGKAHAAFVVAP